MVTEITDVNQVAIPFPYIVPVGTSIHDTATITSQVSGLPATGTLTYEFFTTIDGTGTHTDEVVNVNPDGTVPDSALHGPLAAGVYSFIAVYSGDSNYADLSQPPFEPLKSWSGQERRQRRGHCRSRTTSTTVANPSSRTLFRWARRSTIPR